MNMVSKKSNSKDVLIYAAGDVVFNTTGDYKSQFDLILPTLREADIRYCQFEQVLSDRGVPLTVCPPGLCAPAKYVDGVKHAGFDIVSCNGNHAMEFGAQAFVDTFETLEMNGIKTAGVGKDIDQARKPAIMAFLAYNSIIHYGRGSELAVAKPGWPGVAPMRAYTFYDLWEYEQPGIPAKVHTFPNREDLRALKRDVEKAKASADVVVVALHFGIHQIRAELAEYQQDVCYAAIDAGADVIIGTHPHIQKAIEVYKGKVIFYSLANFSFADTSGNQTPPPPLVEKMKLKKEMWGLYEDKKKYVELESCIAKIVVSDKKVKQVSYIPLLVNKEKQPYRPEPGSVGFDAVVKYTTDVTREAGIDTKFRVKGSEVVVVA
jgi:hypothetical protein